MESNTDSVPAPKQGSREDASEIAQVVQKVPFTDLSAKHISENEVSPGAAERVYPIRSMVFVDPSSTTASSDDPISPVRGARQYSIIDSRTWDELQLQRKSDTEVLAAPIVAAQLPTEAPGSGSETLVQSPATPANASLESPAEANGASHLVTTRFKHVETDDGHAVLTGRTVDSFRACEDEPIHIPGAIQTFGAMMVLREESEGKLVVRVVSENSESILGYSPHSLFALENFCDILDEDQAETLLDHVDFIRDEAYDPSADGPEVFIMSIASPAGQVVRLWCAIHVNPANPGLIICEFELEDDRINPISGSSGPSPSVPVDTLGVEFTPEQFAESTVNISQPLRLLRNARRRKGEAAAMEVFSIVSQVQEQMNRAETLDLLLNTTVGIVKELTGFHRILIYQFDSQCNGVVVAELVDPRFTVDLYKGLHFPASDIPKQARDLYRINRVRLLYDREQVTARLVCRTVEDLERPLDMTHAYLRAMSPIHLKYLANMEVRASMSISINGPNELWGLISCHTYDTGMRVSFPLRKMCRLIGETLSRNIERLSYASRLQARKLINTVPTDANPSGYIVASSDDLLKLFDADFGALSIRDETKILGGSTHQEMLALLEYLRMRRINSVLASHNIRKDFTDLKYPPGFKCISGLLYVPLSADGTDFMAFFRRGRLTEIKWGGNPYEQKEKIGRLEPRQSFQIWKETVLDQSREWTDSDVETAAVLCLVYGKFIKVWRQNEEAMQGSQLTKLLLANSAHEVRTPLNAVVNYLEIALEGALDKETRENLTKSYSASKSLIYVINDLLDLTNTEKGQDLIKDEPFDLEATFKEATGMFESEVERKGINYTVLPHPGIPPTVIGDQRRVRQAMSNLISNAIQHTSGGDITVELWRQPGRAEDGSATVQIAVLDTGSGISQARLETLFQELEQVSAESDNRGPGENGQDNLREVVDETEKQVLGLGLATVSRVVRNMQGQLSVRSEEGKGSRFQITLNFPLPADAAVAKDESEIPVHNVVPTVPLQSKEEFVLVDTRSEGRSYGGSDTNSESGKATQKPPTSQPSLDEESKHRPENCDGPPTQEPALVDQPPETKTESTSPTKEPPPKPDPSPLPDTFHVLVAEDDPINSKIIQKRLTKLGHTVCLTVNGEECASAYRADPAQFDAVLMDIQMPIVDGIGSTKMIRQFEQDTPPDSLSRLSKLNGRIPVFAVSASLLEKDAEKYISAGFDGWIMKPINFERLNTLLAGLRDDDVRNSATYQPGKWEKGGWFQGR
ncbi:GAF domain-like protein [Aspergillus caelatus]|uniref:GAF domain-like protein n=1 Tax=Aspergillus caelatus TaxID=61420 RepID=A0A5N7AD54_9EURO|nr:GAF domain-like protein [Aspergillus caelatus]KAE8367593.1 GAF domain-like protein [Aspergillus caelatus]